MPSAIRLSLLAATALTLAACSEEDQQTTQAEPPAVEEPAPEPELNRTDEGVENLREGAERLLEGGRQLSEEAADRASRALEDAAPALERAGEVVDELVNRAISDFETAINELERRIEEADGTEEEVVSEPDAVLAPSEQLNADTRAAARAVAAGVGPDYVGVWAGEPSACAMVDQEAVEEMFAVITPTTIRRYENVCNFDSEPVVDGAATVNASCIAEGNTEEREIRFTLPTPGVLQIGNSEQPDLAELVRCHLPEQQ